MKIINEIKRQILNEADVSQYISMAKKHDWFYFYSDSNQVYERGRESEDKLKKIYDGLSDDDKMTAGKWFQDFYKTDDGSSHSNAVKKWDVERDGVDGFDGVHLSIK